MHITVAFVQGQHRGTEGAVRRGARRADEEGEQPPAEDWTPCQLLAAQGEGPQDLPGRRPCQGLGAGLRRWAPLLALWIVRLLQRSNRAARLGPGVGPDGDLNIKQRCDADGLSSPTLNPQDWLRNPIVHYIVLYSLKGSTIAIENSQKNLNLYRQIN